MAADQRHETLNTILGGALSLVQPLVGYRFSIDSILLGHFARPRIGARILDLGAGCGVVSIMLGKLYRPREIVALEIQPELAALASRNGALNGLPHMTTVCADLRDSTAGRVAAASFDYVVANPPFRAYGRGRESPNLSRRIARGDGGAELCDFVMAASRYAAHRAGVALVFTASRTAELITVLKSQSLEPKRIRFVHPRAGMPASTVLVEARKRGGIEVAIDPPLILATERGEYSEEARRLLLMQPADGKPHA